MNTGASQQNNARQFLLIGAALLVLFYLTRFGSTETTFNVRQVDSVQAKSLMDDGAVVVDVRGTEAYEGRHIPGALSIPLETLRRAIPAALADAKTKNVVVYCGDGVTIGPEGTDILNKAGFVNAVNLKPGISGWEEAGYPVKKAGSGS